MFYKAAPYIIYRGTDETRKWKTFADYTKAEDKTGVDNICLRLNGSINMDTAWKIVSYRTEKESEGVWHALTISYVRKGVPKQAVVAFLKVNNRFGLGDID